LKKNVIYDLLHDNCLNVINPSSVFQYYDMTAIWEDVQTILKHSIPLINLASEPVATRSVRDVYFPDKDIGSEPAPQASYDIRSLHAGVFGTNKGYRFDAGEVMDRLGSYIQTVRPGVPA
jgi:hypothetical protein